jgi:O-antigen/teichoic acid export membrane protein
MSVLQRTFANLVRDTGTLPQKVVRSGVWIGVSFSLEKILSTVQQIVLARLLLPSDFGLLSIALLTIGTLDVFTQTGVEAAVIQRREVDDRTLNTGWTIAVCRASVLFLLLYAAAPYIAGFFQAPRAEALLRALAFTLLLDGTANIGTLQFNRDLNFRRQILLGQSYVLSNLIVSVGLALYYRSVWAMVIARVMGSATRTAVSYLICPYRPRFYLSGYATRNLFHFGRHVFLGNLFVFLITRGDDALVGRVLGVTALGLYTVAYALSNTPATSVTQIVSRVTFPAYARLQSDLSALRSSYYKTLRFTALLTLPIAAGLLTLASDAVQVIYGKKWLPMVPAVQALCVFGAIRSIGATTGPVFYGTGRPEVLTRLVGLQLALTAVAIYPLTRHYDILGTSIAVTSALFLANLVTASKVAGIIGDTFLNLISQFLPSLSASGIMALFLFAVRSTIEGPVSPAGLVLLSALGAGVYIVSILILDRGLWKELRAAFHLVTADG